MDHTGHSSFRSTWADSSKHSQRFYLHTCLHVGKGCCSIHSSSLVHNVFLWLPVDNHICNLHLPLTDRSLRSDTGWNHNRIRNIRSSYPSSCLGRYMCVLHLVRYILLHSDMGHSHRSSLSLHNVYPCSQGGSCSGSC